MSAYERGGRFVRTLVALVLLTLLSTPSAFAQNGAKPDSAATPEEDLANRHAPILLLKQQDHACDTHGEPYDPAIRLRQNLPGQPIAGTAPAAADLAGLDETHYLDFPGNPLRAGCTYERFSRARMQSLTPTAHTRIAREDGRDDFAIQYWFFYVFNDFNRTYDDVSALPCPGMLRSGIGGSTHGQHHEVGGDHGQRAVRPAWLPATHGAVYLCGVSRGCVE
ncbi:MAG: hypothetical protein ACRDJH_03695 [Thermomicrobiales bacterium]